MKKIILEYINFSKILFKWYYDENRIFPIEAILNILSK